MPAFSEEAEVENEMEVAAASPGEWATELVRSASLELPFPDGMSLPVTHDHLCATKGWTRHQRNASQM